MAPVNNGNQMIDLMKANMLMNSKESPLYTFFLMQFLEFVFKYCKQLVEIFQVWLERWMNNTFQKTVTKLNIDDAKNCEIIFQRRFSAQKKSDADQTIVDAVLSRVIEVPEIRAVMYSRSTYIVNYKDEFEIYSNIYFQLIGTEFDESGELDSIRFRIFCKDHNMPVLKKFVNETVESYELRKKYRLGDSLYFFDHWTKKKNNNNSMSVALDFVSFTRTKFYTNRDLENVFFDQKAEVETRIQLFMKKPDWYQKRGIPYTLGFLLHGPPGCGKTSTIKAIANLTQRHIINVNLGQVKSKTQLKQLFHDDKIWVMEKSEIGEKLESYIIPIEKRLYVMEDVDGVDGGSILFRRSKINKTAPAPVVAKLPKPPAHPMDPYNPNCTQPPPEELDSEEKVDLSYILNILDGTLETPGRILIITSNYPEKLDQALIRPGRIDMIIHFKKADRAYIHEMYKCFYETDPDQTLIEAIEDYKWTPAEVNQILFKNYMDGPTALTTLRDADPKQYFKLSYFEDSFEKNPNSETGMTDETGSKEENRKIVQSVENETRGETGIDQVEIENEQSILDSITTHSSLDAATVRTQIKELRCDPTQTDWKTDWISDAEDDHVTMFLDDIKSIEARSKLEIETAAALETTAALNYHRHRHPGVDINNANSLNIINNEYVAEIMPADNTITNERVSTPPPLVRVDLFGKT